MKFKMSPRVALVIIAAIFVLPLAVAFLMYWGAIDYNPVETRNLGTLVQPPVPVDLAGLEPLGSDTIELEALKEHWVVMHHVPKTCDEACREAVTALRQVHRSTGRNQARIRMLLLSKNPDPEAAAELQSIYPLFRLALVNPQMSANLQEIPGSTEGSTYLIDPLGNIMMSYAAGVDPNDLKKDLKRLLTWSKLDEN